MSYAIIKPKRGTVQEWATANPVLALGEIAIEAPAEGVGCGTCRIKFGDGVRAWNDLPYAICPESYSIDIDLQDYATLVVVNALDTRVTANEGNIVAIQGSITDLDSRITTVDTKAGTALTNANTAVTNAQVAQSTADSALNIGQGIINGSQTANKASYATSAGSARASNIAMSLSGTTLSITYS